VSEANRIKPDAPKRCGSCLTASYADAELPVARVVTKARGLYHRRGSKCRRHTAWHATCDMTASTASGALCRACSWAALPVTRSPPKEDAVNDVGRQSKRQELARIATRMRRLILNATGRAGSGHPTSSLSAVEPHELLLLESIDRTAIVDAIRAVI
jgi:hypothetical protein